MGIIDKIKSMFKPKQEEEQVIRVGRTREEKEIRRRKRTTIFASKKMERTKSTRRTINKKRRIQKKY